jgi:hypothetical protein
MNHRQTTIFLCIGLLTSCAKSEGDAAAPSASAPSTATASATAAETASASATASAAPDPPPKAPSWLASVPAKPVTAKVGDRVWEVSAYRNAENVAFGLGEIDSLEGNTATIASLMRVGGRLKKDDEFAPKRPFAPGLFLKPVRTVEQVKPKPKDWVIVPFFGFSTTVGQVEKVEGKLATVKYAKPTKLDAEATEYLEPLESGVNPFSFGAVKKGGKLVQVITYAIDGDQVFGVDSQGNLHKAAKAEVKPLKLEWKDRKVGAKVTVLDFSEGAVQTTIDKVIEDKWIYEVKIAGSTKQVPFHTVFDKI